MSQNLPALQEKAVSLRDYLFSDNVKPVLESAVPRWLSIDRLLRIVFSSTMKNPKLLDCTRESLVQSVMQCAQLGLEPILGRAHLVPYNNKKYMNGQWVKVLECQMQVGYQGFVDLGRRTGDVADIWGENVYENDEFDLQSGMERTLHHRPWFMDLEKRKIGKGGNIIGAYVVWQFKDGTKHPHFMPIHDIHKRREKSQAYRWAETGDPKKGGSKKDSIWHEWPEEQNLKTVIKHSSKLVPLSIEFMQGVELDNMNEIGKGSASAGFMLPGSTLPAIESPTGSASDLADKIKENGADKANAPAGQEQGVEGTPDPPDGPPVSDAEPSYFEREFKGLKKNYPGKLANHISNGLIDEATEEDRKALIAKWDHDETTKGTPFPIPLWITIDEPPETDPLETKLKCPENSPTYGDEMHILYCRKVCNWPEKSTQCQPFIDAGEDVAF